MKHLEIAIISLSLGLSIATLMRVLFFRDK
jgi:hypothetical protein